MAVEHVRHDRRPSGSAWARARAAAIAVALAVSSMPFAAEAVFLLRASVAQLAATARRQLLYFEVARRAAAGEGFTFDGINSTSGFHPLWQWTLTGLNVLVPGETAFVRAARLLSLGFHALRSDWSRGSSGGPQGPRQR